ncbi:AI-2E family transporter [Myroides indicus]|uniref:Putative PurR-regulated permease PerM n=1 Tax=Myroides indicus TaxID=1323422 RepID=A0A4R7F144_9FLAO|nr:AI-2E family transporter [Myroides indicus]TDS58108.1 putative PurR-regulated permease PerM [Myroides indicus]
MFLGLLIAVLLIPVSNFLETRIRIPRVVSALLVVFLFVVIIASVFAVIGSQIAGLKEDWPAFQKQLMDSAGIVQNWIYNRFGIEQVRQISYLEEAASNSLDTGTNLLGKAVSSLSTVLMFVFFSLLYAVFLLIYRRHLVKFLMISFRETHQEVVLDIVTQIQNMVKKYLMGLILQMAIVSIMALIAFSVMGIKYSFMLAIITGVLNVLPYIGVLVALIISVLITFATASATKVLLVISAYIVIHLIDGNIVMPKIVGSKVKVNSLVVVIGLIIGEMMWGIFGMLLTIPSLAILKIVFDRVKSLKPWGFLLGEENNEIPLITEREKETHTVEIEEEK